MTPRDLRLLVMHVSTRCDQACGHCSIWKPNGKAASDLSSDERLALIREAHALGARSVLFTGGEPLLCDHIEALARASHDLGLAVQIATNGVGLSRTLSWLGETVAEVFVSVDGPEAIHDRVRGPRMFSRLSGSIAAVRGLSKRPRLVGRSVISSRNAAALEATVGAARALGLDAISFLPIDVTSGAFGGGPAARCGLKPNQAQVAMLRAAITRLDSAGELGGFVTEDAGKLVRMTASFLTDDADRRAPACNAPEWSSVVDADGALRPCFFQPAVARVGSGASLSAARGSTSYATSLRQLGPEDRTCASCVCPKHVAPVGASFKGRVNAALGRVWPRLFQGPGIPA